MRLIKENGLNILKADENKLLKVIGDDYKPQIKDEEGNISIDMNSVCWYAAPSSTSGYKSANWWGAGNENKKQENLLKKLPYISAGLNTTVKNRYLLPIATSTIADSRNMIQKSYGF